MKMKNKVKLIILKCGLQTKLDICPWNEQGICKFPLKCDFKIKQDSTKKDGE